MGRGAVRGVRGWEEMGEIGGRGKEREREREKERGCE